MGLADEYRRQKAWRDWPAVLEALPALRGQTVLDLGCGVGDQAAELAARGARVIGFDLNEDLLRSARAKGIANTEFRSADLRAPFDPGVEADGLWCGFSPAYFPDLQAALVSWGEHLRPGGWVALTEIDAFFAHEPLGARARALLETYAEGLLSAGHYDFNMGRKLPGHLERAGFLVEKTFTLEDLELSFQGAARLDVLQAWRERLDRLGRLRDICGAEFEAVRDEFLACLARPDHRSVARVCCCIAVKPPSASLIT